MRQLPAERGVDVRVIQRFLRLRRQRKRAADVATVRLETTPGHQLQIDFRETVVTMPDR